VRLTGCGLRCTWCDTPYAFTGGETLTPDDVIARATGPAIPFVCLTGGEPMDHPECGALAQAFLDRNYRVSVETGGYHDISTLPNHAAAIVDVKCPGSAMESHNRWANFESLLPGDELKFVLRDERDYVWARRVLSERPAPDGVGVLFSPVHGALDPRDLVGWVVRDRLSVRVNLQIHKYVWGPDATGV
jgi:7-carboxy-7-deazaguanine synthase